MKYGCRAASIGVTLMLAACGGDDGGGGGGLGASFGDIADKIAEPTGTVSATTAPEVAVEFERISQNGAASGPKQGGATQEMACPAGGKMTITAEGNQSQARSVIDYDSCCYEASCCVNGGGTWFFSTQAGASYSYCGSYSIEATCGGETATAVNYEGCFSATGWVYSIKVAGESFAVTGNYSNGNGTLEVTGANGSFTCSYTNGSGSCTGSSGEFSF